MFADTDGHTADPRLDDLLLRWEELHDRGQSLSADELCSACPELAGELARRIALLRQLDPLLVDTMVVSRREPGPGRAGGSSRELATARAEFRDLRFHAAGSLGEVFLAYNAELNRDVALKFLKPSRAREPESRRRFLQEAEVTGRLEHPGVVPIYALGADAAGATCYAMRFIRGETLQNAIDRFHAAERPGRDHSERSLGLRELLDRFVSVCSTVGYAHSRGVLHRDLKPRNVMLGKYDETLVVDWGLAKPFEPDHARDEAGEEPVTPSSGDSGSDTPTVGVVGTLAYMSPEQGEARWDVVGPASDIFSLGAILYAILTGQAPYGWDARGAILDNVKRCEFPAPRQIKPQAPRALEAICLKAMAREPTGRYATALELAADVKRWLADQPLAAWREPPWLRARRWTRRHRTLVTSAAAVLVLALFGLTGFASVVAGKNLELEQQRQRALAREALAIDAVKKFRDAVQDNPELKNHPELDALRKDLLKQPMQFFRQLRNQLQADRDTRPDALAKLADANLDLARTTNEIGSFADAIQSLVEAIAILERLAHDQPTVIEYQRNLAKSHLGYGNLLIGTGRPAEALKPHLKALGIRERLVLENPTVTEYQSDLAISHHHIGNLLSVTGQPAESLKEHRRALAIRERLARDNPEIARYQNELAKSHSIIGLLLNEAGQFAEALESHRPAAAIQKRLADDQPRITEYQSDLATTHINIGVALIEMGRTDEATESYGRALAVLEPLARDHPTVSVYQSDLATIHNNIGNLRGDAGRPTEALESHRRALAIRERLVRDHPYNHYYQSSLGATLHNIAETEIEQGRWPEARELLERAIEHQRAALAVLPHHPFYQQAFKLHLLNLAKVHGALNHPEEALRVTRELAALPRENPTDSYNLACVLALTVPLVSGEQRQALAAEAVLRLKEAVAAGWNDAGKTNSDPDLIALRDREDFRKLLAELFDRGFPADPFGR